jgi:hypothetical protein
VTTEEGKYIPFVNIGIPEAGIGTVSNSTGKFQLDISGLNKKLMLKISCIGFKEKAYTLEELIGKDEVNFKLEEKTFALPQVTITPKSNKTDFLGNSKDAGNIFAGADNLGTEIGIPIKIKKPVFIQKIHLLVGENKVEKLRLRINFYDYSKGDPGENISRESITTILPKGAQEFVLDVANHNIVMEKDFFLGVEIVEGEGSFVDGVWFKGGLWNGPTYVRKTSQANWEKVYDAMFNVGAGFGVTVLY